MIVGRIIKGPRHNEDNKIIPYSVVGPPSLCEDPRFLKRQHSLKYSVKSSTTLMPTTQQVKKEEKIKKPNFESVDEFRIKNIYSDYINIKELNAPRINDFMKKIPEEISTQLKYQEKSLELKNREDRRFNELVHILAKKTKKKEEDLLIRKVDSYRMKKEIFDVMENKKPLDERYGVYSWVIGLRRPKNFTGSRVSYVNLGNKYNALWLGVKETVPKNIEMIRKPFSDSIKEFKTFTRNKFLIRTTENNINASNVESLNDLEVFYYLNLD
jgi:hypothetical protein